MNHYHQASLAGHYDDDEALFVNGRSEEHTSELQSRCNLVCRLMLEKKYRGITPVTSRRVSSSPRGRDRGGTREDNAANQRRGRRILKGGVDFYFSLFLISG